MEFQTLAPTHLSLSGKHFPEVSKPWLEEKAKASQVMNGTRDF